MKERIRTLNVFLLLTLALTACGGGKNGPPSASRAAADLRVTDQLEYRSLKGRLASLSPDGQWLAGFQGDVLGVYDAESLTEHSGVVLESVHPAEYSVAWSPDSARIAIADEAVRRLFESDLWVMEVETGKLVNLTDDGVSGSIMRPEPRGITPLIDVAPTWSPDGKKLLFSRSVYDADEGSGTGLYRISGSGGDAQEIITLSSETPLVVWYGLHWSSDGKHVLYTVAHANPEHPDNGIWIVEQDGKNPKKLIGSDPELGPAVLMEISAPGDKGLVYYFRAAGMRASDPNVSFYVILDLKTGDVLPLKQAPGQEAEFSNLLNATFSPDGSKILYVYRDVKDQKFRLVVRDLESAVENVLLTSDTLLGFQADIGLGLDWAENDSVYVATPPASLVGGMLIRLGTE